MRLPPRDEAERLSKQSILKGGKSQTGHNGGLNSPMLRTVTVAVHGGDTDRHNLIALLDHDDTIALTESADLGVAQRR